MKRRSILSESERTPHARERLGLRLLTDGLGSENVWEFVCGWGKYVSVTGQREVHSVQEIVH